MSILYPETLLNLFVSSNRFFFFLQYFLYIRSCYLQIEIVLLFSLQFWVPFISFSCPVALARTSRTCWIDETKVGILVFFLISRERFQSLITEYDVLCFSYMALCWGNFFLFLVYLIFLSWKCVGFHQMHFSASIEMIKFIPPFY